MSLVQAPGFEVNRRASEWNEHSALTDDIPPDQSFFTGGIDGEHSGGAAAAAAAPTHMGDVICSITLVNTVVGSGVLGLPFAMQQAALIPGAVVLSLAAGLSWYSMQVLIVAAGRFGADTYKGLCVRSYGPKAGLGIEAGVGIYTFLSCISYGVILKDNVSDLLVGWHVGDPWSEKGLVLLWVGVILLGLSCLPDLSALRFSSGLGVLCALYVTGVIAAKFFSGGIGPDVNYGTMGSTLFKAFPVLTVAFNGHFNVLPLYQKMRHPQHMAPVLFTSMTGILLVYALVAISGYLTFGPSTDSDILNNYSGGAAVEVAKAGICLTIMGAYPLNFFAFRASLNTVMSDVSSYKRSFVKDVALTTVLVPLSLFIALVTPDKNGLGVVLDYNGALFGTLIVFTAPGLILWKCRHGTVETVVAGALIGTGVVLAIMGTAITTQKLISGDQ